MDKECLSCPLNKTNLCAFINEDAQKKMLKQFDDLITAFDKVDMSKEDQLIVLDPKDGLHMENKR